MPVPGIVLELEISASDSQTVDPIDSAKSIYQRNALLQPKGEEVPKPKLEFFKKHMYRGLGVSMARSCVVNAIFFSSFEFIKKHIKLMDEQGRL